MTDTLPAPTLVVRTPYEYKVRHAVSLRPGEPRHLAFQQTKATNQDAFTPIMRVGRLEAATDDQMPSGRSPSGTPWFVPASCPLELD